MESKLTIEQGRLVKEASLIAAKYYVKLKELQDKMNEQNKRSKKIDYTDDNHLYDAIQGFLKAENHLAKIKIPFESAYK